MPRKEKYITITTEGRDNGKVFFIKEKPAVQGEKWALRTLLALTRSGVDVPEDVLRSGWAGIAIVGIKALLKLHWDAEVEELLDEMFECVKICRNKRSPTEVFEILEDDIEEISTRLLLRLEVLELHAGFSTAGSVSGTSTSATASPVSKDTPTTSPE